MIRANACILRCGIFRLQLKTLDLKKDRVDVADCRMVVRTEEFQEPRDGGVSLTWAGLSSD